MNTLDNGGKTGVSDNPNGRIAISYTNESFEVVMSRRGDDGNRVIKTFECQAPNFGQAEEAAWLENRGWQIIRVTCTSRQERLQPMPDEDRCNPAYYNDRDLRCALEGCDNLLGDYMRGGNRGGSMDWEDLDATREVLQANLPNLNKANQRVWEAEFASEEADSEKVKA